MAEGNTAGIRGSNRFVLVTWARERAPSRGSMVGVVICIALLFLIMAVISVRYNGNNYKWDESYAPGETRIGCESSVFCSSVTLENPSLTSPASVYLLRKQPKLTARYNFTITKSLVLGPGYYQYWNFYLYPGSNYTFSSCLTSGSGAVSYYVIKGVANFQNWYRTDGYTDALDSTSYSGSSNKTLSRSFTAEDEYYFVLYNPYKANAQVQLSLAFNRTEYSPQSGCVVSSCTASPSSKCTMAIPYSTDYTVLIEAGAPGDGDWGTNVELDTACGPRVWVYAMIVILLTLAVAALVGCIVLTCCCIKRRNSRYTHLPTVVMQDVVSMTTFEDSESANPPPYTPEEASPPSYKPNPPEYTP